MRLLIFPLFMSSVFLSAVVWILFRHGAFMEGVRNQRARRRVVEVARNAEKSFGGYARIRLIAVVCHDESVLLGYKAYDPSLAADQKPKLERPGNGETMVAWLPPSMRDRTSVLEQWCHDKVELYMKIDTEARTVRISSLELDNVVELALSPAS